MKTFRAVLSPDDVVAALGDWVARKHALPAQPARAEVLFVYDLTDLSNVKVEQARVEVTISE